MFSPLPRYVVVGYVAPPPTPLPGGDPAQLPPLLAACRYFTVQDGRVIAHNGTSHRDIGPDLLFARTEGFATTRKPTQKSLTDYALWSGERFATIIAPGATARSGVVWAPYNPDVVSAALKKIGEHAIDFDALVEFVAVRWELSRPIHARMRKEYLRLWQGWRRMCLGWDDPLDRPLSRTKSMRQGRVVHGDPLSDVLDSTHARYCRDVIELLRDYREQVAAHEDAFGGAIFDPQSSSTPTVLVERLAALDKEYDKLGEIRG